MRNLTSTFLAAASLILSACGPSAEEQKAKADAEAAAATAAAAPKPVNGWIEFPLAEGVIKIHSTEWRTDTIKVPVPKSGGELEYKLGMKKGDSLVYSIDYGDIGHAGNMVSEFHGHTEKRADGIGDLMFYSRTGGALQHGQFTAPWDGIHGWYLKNDSAKDTVVTIKLAGFYEMIEQ
jgi:hypothetical protein